jgi:hypothetical protein
MPYYKGVYFEQAFHREEDLHAHNAATPSGNPVAPAPAEPDFAVSLPDRAPAVDTVVTVESDPFPSFVPEEEPETQPEPLSEDTATPAESPDAKKKKKSGSKG